ncbi:DMT family transporter [uncultured Hymenobacter sp.]|uniref:DMT family transporter n=1 Tax=uncultured Hymenobacter sp. TaxID=170016 RepID=UPI0035C9571E
MIKDYLKLHFIVLLWGFTAILGKLLSLPPVEIVLWRTGLAAAGIGLLLTLRGQPLRVRGAQLARLLGVGTLVAAHWITFFLAARLSSVSVCLAGMATLALWTSLLEPLLLRRPVRGYEVGLGLLTMGGLYLVSQAELDQLAGLLVAVLSAGLSALFSVINSRLTQQHSPLQLTFYEMLGASLSIALFLPFYSRYFTPGAGLHLGLSGLDWLWLLLLAGACTVYAFSVFVELMKRLTPFTVNLTINLEPVYGIVLAVLIFGDKERMAGGFYLGTAVILLSVLIHPLVARRFRRSEQLAVNS